MTIEHVTFKTPTGIEHGYRMEYSDGHHEIENLACEIVTDYKSWTFGWLSQVAWDALPPCWNEGGGQ